MKAAVTIPVLSRDSYVQMVYIVISWLYRSLE